MTMDINGQQHNILKGYNMLLYFAGSMITYEPSEECVTDFWKNGVLKNLPVSSSNPNFIKAASQLRESCTDKNICGKELHEDYLRLFSGDASELAPAYESLYGKKRDIEDKESANVSEFYNSYGWVSKFKGIIKDDHLGVELLFLTLLIDKYLVLDDEACRGEMKDEIKRFINQHILSWIREWNVLVQAYSNTLCFKGIATLIIACTEDILSICGQNQPDNISTVYLKN
jgi:TorA maturation chaperone TorD